VGFLLSAVFPNLPGELLAGNKKYNIKPRRKDRKSERVTSKTFPVSLSLL